MHAALRSNDSYKGMGELGSDYAYGEASSIEGLYKSNNVEGDLLR